jgi:hypothetical protein
MRKEVKDSKFKLKEQRAKFNEEKKIIEEKEENLITEVSELDLQRKELKNQER